MAVPEWIITLFCTNQKYISVYSSTWLTRDRFFGVRYVINSRIILFHSLSLMSYFISACPQIIVINDADCRILLYSFGITE
jgi:hypothetical protein